MSWRVQYKDYINGSTPPGILAHFRRILALWRICVERALHQRQDHPNDSGVMLQ